MENEDRLLHRFEATSKAQSRYLYLLALALAFFLIIDSRLANDPGNGVRLIGFPGLGLGVEARVLWLLSPLVISVILLDALGALQASTSAWEAIRNCPTFEDSPWELLDTTPNLIDFAVFTTPKTPRVGRSLALLSYPAFLSLAWWESMWLALKVALSSGSASYSRPVVLLFALLSVPVIWRMLRLWRRKLTDISNVWLRMGP